MTETITTFVTFNMSSNVVDEFKTEWLKDAEFISKQPGFKGNTLYKRSGGNRREEFVNVAHRESEDTGQVGFINVAHWENEDSLKAAREAVLVERQKEGRNQATLFKELHVSVSAENYVAEVSY